MAYARASRMHAGVRCMPPTHARTVRVDEGAPVRRSLMASAQAEPGDQGHLLWCSGAFQQRVRRFEGRGPNAAGHPPQSARAKVYGLLRTLTLRVASQRGGGYKGRGLKRSGVDPPLRSSRACLHTAFIAFSFHCVFDCPLALCASLDPP